MIGISTFARQLMTERALCDVTLPLIKVLEYIISPCSFQLFIAHFNYTLNYLLSMMELQVSFSLNSEKRARETTPPRRRSPVKVTQREDRQDHRQNGVSPPRHDRECHDNKDRQLVSIESGRFGERSSRSDHHRELHDSKHRAGDQREHERDRSPHKRERSVNRDREHAEQQRDHREERSDNRTRPHEGNHRESGRGSGYPNDREAQRRDSKDRRGLNETRRDDKRARPQDHRESERGSDHRNDRSCFDIHKVGVRFIFRNRSLTITS